MAISLLIAGSILCCILVACATYLFLAEMEEKAILLSLVAFIPAGLAIWLIFKLPAVAHTLMWIAVAFMPGVATGWGLYQIYRRERWLVLPVALCVLALVAGILGMML